MLYTKCFSVHIDPNLIFSLTFGTVGNPKILCIDKIVRVQLKFGKKINNDYTSLNKNDNIHKIDILDIRWSDEYWQV